MSIYLAWLIVVALMWMAYGWLGRILGILTLTAVGAVGGLFQFVADSNAERGFDPSDGPTTFLWVMLGIYGVLALITMAVRWAVD